MNRANNNENIVKQLENIKERTHVFIDPVTPEMLICYLNGLTAGYLLSSEYEHYEYIQAKKKTISSFGWEVRSTNVHREMREKNYDENKIIDELLLIESETWRALEKKK